MKVDEISKVKERMHKAKAKGRNMD